MTMQNTALSTEETYYLLINHDREGSLLLDEELLQEQWLVLPVPSIVSLLGLRGQTRIAAKLHYPRQLQYIHTWDIAFQ